MRQRLAALALAPWLVMPSLVEAQVPRTSVRAPVMRAPVREGAISRTMDRPLGTPPGGFRVSAVTATSVTLSWQAVPGVLGYTVVKGPATSTEWLHTDPITTTSFTHQGLAPNTTVQYTVFSEYGLEGQFKNAPAPSVSATTSQPVGPTRFTAVRRGSSVILNWTAIPGAAGYTLGRYHPSGGPILTGSAPVQVTSFTDTNPPAGEQRYVLSTSYGENIWAPPVSATVTVPRTRGKYRVTINGFQAHQETKDHMLEADGKRDEIYVAAYVSLFDKTLPLVSKEVRTYVYGDVNGIAHVRAGSASTQGGIRSGDKYPPVSNPWMRSGEPTRNQLPLLVWEGNLVQGANVLFFVPSIWEDDGNSDHVYELWRSGELQKIVRLSSGEYRNLLGTSALQAESRAIDKTHHVPINVTTDLTGEKRDLPLGSSSIHGGASLAFFAQSVVLTVDAIEAALTSPSGIGGMPPGHLSIEYKNFADLGGHYTLYLQVERIS